MKMLRIKRVFLALLLASSVGVPAAAQPATQVRVSTIPILDMATFFAALEQGYFKTEGLDVTTQTTQQGGSVGIPALVSGAYDIAYSNTTTIIQALQQGIDLKIIAGSSFNAKQPPEQVALMSRKADGLKTGKDMEGKSIAVNARNGVQWLFSRAWVKATGGDPDKVNYREVAFPAMIDALKNKQVDAALTIEPFLTFGQRDPDLEVMAWPFNVVAPGMQAAGYVVTAETAAKRADLVNRFLSGLNKGADWVNANLGQEPYLKVVNGYTRLDPRLISALPLLKADNKVDLRSLERMAQLMRENGLLTSQIDLASKIYKQ
jgi:NitT/TauT family transport system substrate-binding protein